MDLSVEAIHPSTSTESDLPLDLDIDLDDALIGIDTDVQPIPVKTRRSREVDLMPNIDLNEGPISSRTRSQTIRLQDQTPETPDVNRPISNQVSLVSFNNFEF